MNVNDKTVNSDLQTESQLMIVSHSKRLSQCGHNFIKKGGKNEKINYIRNRLVGWFIKI